MGFSVQLPALSSVSLPIQWTFLVLVAGGYLSSMWLLDRQNAHAGEQHSTDSSGVIQRIRVTFGFTDWCAMSLFFAFSLGLVPTTVEALVSEANTAVWAVTTQMLIAAPVLGIVYFVMWQSGSYKVRDHKKVEEPSNTRDGHVKQVLSTLSIGDWFVLLLFTTFSTIPVFNLVALAF